jgi:hypothetical protein
MYRYMAVWSRQQVPSLEGREAMMDERKQGDHFESFVLMSCLACSTKVTCVVLHA